MISNNMMIYLVGPRTNIQENSWLAFPVCRIGQSRVFLSVWLFVFLFLNRSAMTRNWIRTTPDNTATAFHKIHTSRSSLSEESEMETKITKLIYCVVINKSLFKNASLLFKYFNSLLRGYLHEMYVSFCLLKFVWWVPNEDVNIQNLCFLPAKHFLNSNYYMTWFFSPIKSTDTNLALLAEHVQYYCCSKQDRESTKGYWRWKVE